MTRVLHVYKTYFPDPPGGVQEAIRQICLSTARAGVRSSIFCLSPNPHPQLLADDVPVWRERSWMAPASCDIGGINALRQFRRLARDHDVVHYHFPWPFADIMHLAAQTRGKSVMTYHSDIVKQSVLSRFYSPVMWKMLASMDKIVATSPAYAASSKILTDSRIVPRLRIIPLGMQDIFSDNAPPPQPSDESDPYFLFIGALRYYKGLPILLKAAKSVSARILVAGEGNQGTALRRMAQELGCSNVEFLGRITDEEKFRLLGGCRAFVMPSDERSEAFGVALIEAAMYGRPMISTEIHTGTSYVNLHMNTGFVVPPKNPPALAKAMNALLQEPELARSFGVKARDRYRALFSGASLGTAYSSLYEEILTYESPLLAARATKTKTSQRLSRSSGSPW